MSHPCRRGRNIHGVLLLDKPHGLSSNYALQAVKGLYKANRAGHTGALDPLATGMLPICLGEATKFSGFLLNADKHYSVIAKLGQRTDTSDADGCLLEQRPVCFTRMQLEIALDNFRGQIQQVPPMYSAIKYQGKKLYEYARQGIEVPRKSRMITVYQINISRWDRDELELKIYCSKGTYIRTIIDDLGEQLGCGAHVIYLRRLQVATYPIERMVTLKYLNDLLEQPQTTALLKSLDRLLMPVDSPVKNFPEVNLSLEAADYIKKGRTVQVSTAFDSTIVRITEGEKHKFIGIGTIDTSDRLTPRRLVLNHVGVDSE